MKILTTLIYLSCLLAVTSIEAAQVEYRFFQGMTDGSEQTPDGAEYIVLIEEEIEDDEPVEVYRLQWDQQKWTEEQVVDLDEWRGKQVFIKTLGSPGPERNTGWDWLAIGEPRITVNGETEVDVLKLHQDGKTTVTTLLDAEKKNRTDVIGEEEDGVLFGGTADPGERVCGGEAKQSIFQHPAWDGQVGDTIVRWELDLAGLAVEPADKLAVTWGHLKRR